MNQKTLCNILFFICCLFCTLSCNSDDEPAEPIEEEPLPFRDRNCKPTGLYTRNEDDPDDSIAYRYNAEGRVSHILHFPGKTMRDYDSIEYDDLGRVAWVRKTYASSGVVMENFQFEYDGNTNKPVSLNNWGINIDGYPSKTFFTHDDKGRLTVISRYNNTKWHYEYNDNNNVSKVYYNGGLSAEDFLGRENHTFDDRKKFYANEPALVTIYHYMLRFDPSKNNVTSATIHYVAPLAISRLDPPRKLDYRVSYDDNGWIKNHYIDYPNQVVEFYCEDVHYSCD